MTRQDDIYQATTQWLFREPQKPLSWYVLHTRPRCEKKAAAYCHEIGFPVYLPLKHRDHHYGTKLRSFSLPVFPGYIFCVCTNRTVVQVKRNRYIAHVLDVVDQKQLMRQLAQIQSVLSMGSPIELMPYLKKGQPVRVRSGVFKGLEGMIDHVRSSTKVVLNVEMIQQAVCVEISAELLEGV